MPVTRGTNRKSQKPRRTHNLGGCATCRRRHIKCDQLRPECGVCRSANLECGFPNPIRWASTSTGPATKRSPQTSEKEALKNQSQSPSTLKQHDSTRSSHQSPILSRDGTDRQFAPPDDYRADVNPGLDVDGEELPVSSQSLLEYSASSNRNSTLNDAPVDWGWLFDASSGLGWNDLFDDRAPFATSFLPDVSSESLAVPSHTYMQQWNVPDTTESQDLLYGAQPLGAWQPNAADSTDVTSLPLSPNAVRTVVNESTALEDAKFLLKHFREAVIPKFSPVPMASTSPWEVMNLRAAIQTLADMTYLQNPHVKCASKANLFALLGCAAYALIKRQSTIPSETLSSQRATQILDYAFSRAKMEMQESLKAEISGVQKAKYKDQLMAINSLIALSTLMGMATSARCYLIDAERLVRLRGLAKREVSRRARLLHHVYTWLRIIGESTFVLHDYKSSAFQTRIENMLNGAEGLHCSSPVSDRSKTTTREYSELDDFLRIDTHAQDSESDFDASKDAEAGIRDIHLSDARQWTQTMYMEVYGIPEVWLALVSQVTRIGNVMDYLDTRSAPASQAFTRSLERKLNRLEQKICSFAAKHSTINTLFPNQEDESSTTSVAARPSAAHQAMLRAMSSALVIFFYRRLRRVNPWILQAHVNDVIAALKNFGQARDGAESCAGTVGTPWPAFIAGCEAMAPESRQWLLSWVEGAACLSTSSGFIECQNVMKKVWEQRDTLNKSSSGHRGSNQGREEDLCTWIDILRKDKLWLMLY